MKTTKFARKPFHVNAVQVTDENMQEVAAWCQGDIRVSADRQFIKVKVHRALNERQTQAFVGDWVLKAGTGFKVYTDKAFKDCFDNEAPTRNVFEQNSPEESEEQEPVEELRTVDVPAFSDDSTRVKLGFNEPRDLMKD